MQKEIEALKAKLNSLEKKGRAQGEKPSKPGLKSYYAVFDIFSGFFGGFFLGKFIDGYFKLNFVFASALSIIGMLTGFYIVYKKFFR